MFWATNKLRPHYYSSKPSMQHHYNRQKVLCNSLAPHTAVLINTIHATQSCLLRFFAELASSAYYLFVKTSLATPLCSLKSFVQLASSAHYLLVKTSLAIPSCSLKIFVQLASSAPYLLVKPPLQHHCAG